jgi:hypothetical protein
LKSSGNSSATASPPPVAPRSATPPRRAFALTGRSATLDPRRDAVRPDLADARLAERIFAPHYAVAVTRPVALAIPLRLARDPASEEMVRLEPGDAFELLDVIGDTGWGIAPAHGLVGYLPVSSLGDPAA